MTTDDAVLAARARSHDPVRALARGWSITRGPDGSVLRSVDGLADGDLTTTTLADGSFAARISGPPVADEEA